MADLYSSMLGKTVYWDSCITQYQVGDTVAAIQFNVTISRIRSFLSSTDFARISKHFHFFEDMISALSYY